MNADTLTSYGVECLLRLKGVQVTRILHAKSAFICVTCYLSDSRHSTSTKLSVSAVRILPYIGGRP